MPTASCAPIWKSAVTRFAALGSEVPGFAVGAVIHGVLLWGTREACLGWGSAPGAEGALATGVGLSRVHLGHHFPSDVAVGGLLGVASGTFLAWIFRVPKAI